MLKMNLGKNRQLWKRISEEQINEFHRILHFDEAYSELSAIFYVIF